MIFYLIKFYLSHCELLVLYINTLVVCVLIDPGFIKTAKFHFDEQVIPKRGYVRKGWGPLGVRHKIDRHTLIDKVYKIYLHQYVIHLKHRPKKMNLIGKIPNMCNIVHKQLETILIFYKVTHICRIKQIRKQVTTYKHDNYVKFLYLNVTTRRLLILV